MWLSQKDTQLCTFFWLCIHSHWLEMYALWVKRPWNDLFITHLDHILRKTYGAFLVLVPEAVVSPVLREGETSYYFFLSHFSCPESCWRPFMTVTSRIGWLVLTRTTGPFTLTDCPTAVIIPDYIMPTAERWKYIIIICEKKKHQQLFFVFVFVFFHLRNFCMLMGPV